MSWPGERQRHAMSSRGIQSVRPGMLLDARGIPIHGMPDTFWVVTKPSQYSTVADVLFDSDISYLINQVRGGLAEKDIVGVYADPDDAKEAMLDAMYDAQLKDTSWEPFVERWGMNYESLQAFADEMGFQSVGDLTSSLSPKSLYRKNETKFVEVFSNYGEPEHLQAEKLDEPYLVALRREHEEYFESHGVKQGGHGFSPRTRGEQ